MPTTLVSTNLFSINRTVSRFRVHFKHGLISKIVSACRYESLDPDSNRIPNYFAPCLWIRIRTVFQIVFHFGLDPDSNRYPNYSIMLGVRIRIRTVFLFISSLWFGSGLEPLSKLFFFTMRYGSGFEESFLLHIKPAYILNHMY